MSRAGSHISVRAPTGLLSKVEDQLAGTAQAKPDMPKFGAEYKYDRLYQLTQAKTVDGILNYTYELFTFL